jgi:hypothetical protein
LFVRADRDPAAGKFLFMRCDRTREHVTELFDSDAGDARFEVVPWFGTL